MSLDRAAARREDADWLAAARLRADALFVPVLESRPLVIDAGGRARARLIAGRDWPDASRAARELVLLGEWSGTPCFAALVDAPPAFGADAAFVELRSVLQALDESELELLMLARAYAHWHATHRYCGSCGAPTRSERGGHLRRCTACDRECFPRIDPAIIVLVADASRCLLGRQASWPAGRYSTLAGFVEPGESIEQAVAREVLEESGVAIDAPRYLASQPWPFPASLMLGFEAAPLSGGDRITVDGVELEDARWFTRADIVAGLADGTLNLSPSRSMSWRLLARWFDADGGPLADLVGGP